MTRFFTCAVIVIGLGASATLTINPRTGKSDTNTEALFAADGAFRDGVYLGKLAAESGQPMHTAIGRWSTNGLRVSTIGTMWKSPGPRRPT